MNVDELNELLHAAASKNNAERCSELIQQGADVNSADAAGYTALHSTDSPAVARLLLDAGARIEAQAEGGLTPLLSVVGDRAWSYAHFLLDEGANPHVLSNTGRTLIGLAATRHPNESTLTEYSRLLHRLITAGVSPDQPDQSGETPLIAAIQSINLNACQLLLSAGADPELPYYNATPLKVAQTRAAALNGLQIPNAASQQILHLLEEYLLQRKLEQTAAVSAATTTRRAKL